MIWNPFSKKSETKEVSILDLMDGNEIELKALAWSRLFGLGQTTWLDYDYETKVRYGYELNTTCHTVINELATCGANIPFTLWSGKGSNKTQIEDHPLLDLLSRPNPQQSKEMLLFGMIAYLHIGGDSYTEVTRTGGLKGKISSGGKVPMELYNHLPYQIKLTIKDTLITEFIREVDGQIVRQFPVVNDECNLLHLKRFNPYNTVTGLSDLHTVSYPVDIINETFKSGKRFIENDGNIGSILVAKNDNISENAVKLLQKQFEQKYGGTSNAGKTPVLVGVDYHQSKNNPKEMDYIEGLREASRHVAQVFGMPPQLLGIQGDNTYNNQHEARLAWYENKIIPMCNMIVGELNNWLVPMYGDNLTLSWDWDAVPAIAYKREKVYTMLKDVNFLTINEKRAQVGYEPIPDGDVLTVAPTPQDGDNEDIEDDDSKKSDDLETKFTTTTVERHNHFVEHGANITKPAKAPGEKKTHVHGVSWPNGKTGKPKIHEADGHTHGVKPE